MHPPSRVPWQITGNHWVAIPCIHPRDASIHCVGVVSSRQRAAIEIAGCPEFLDGMGAPLLRPVISLDGHPQTIGSSGLAWEREGEWLPAFAGAVGELRLRGVICAPVGRDSDLPAFLIQIGVENRAARTVSVSIGLEGTAGHAQKRVRTSRALAAPVIGESRTGVVFDLHGDTPVAGCVACETGCAAVSVTSAQFRITTDFSLPPDGRGEATFFFALGSDADGAEAMIRALRRKGSPELLSVTRQALRNMEQTAGATNLDRVINRNLMFACFNGVTRAIDDAHLYVVRSRVPWNGRGVTVTAWEALMWVLPAVQLADESLAREVLLRVCELHGYAPGQGVHYVDGALFEPGFSLEGAAAFPIAVDEYIAQTNDDHIVEEHVVAHTLYGVYDDLELRKARNVPLFSTEVNPDGSAAPLPYTAHGNAAVARALDVLKRTLDEKTAEKVLDAEAVRGAVLKRFLTGELASEQVLASAIDLDGNRHENMDAGAALYWLPWLDMMSRDDSLYRRTVKRWDAENPCEMVVQCGRLFGPARPHVLEWLRRAPLDNGIACERVDQEGRVAGNGGDAALAGLLAYTLWYTLHTGGGE